MIDAGDPVTLTVTLRDANGVLTDPAALPTVVVTRPDQTTPAPPVVTKVSVGVYQCVWTDTANAGLYLVAWTSTSGLIAAFDDSFLVVAANQQIIGLDDAKRAVGFDQVDVNRSDADVEDLRGLIAAAKPVMEDLCGPILPCAFDEYVDGTGPLAFTNRAPIISLTLVTESYGPAYRTLTNQPLSGAGFDAYGYTVELRTGAITRRVSGTPAPFAFGRGTIHVTGTYGRLVMPPAILRATRRYVRWCWQTERQGQRPQGARPEQVMATPSGFPVPSAVVAMCGDELRPLAIM